MSIYQAPTLPPASGVPHLDKDMFCIPVTRRASPSLRWVLGKQPVQITESTQLAVTEGSLPAKLSEGLREAP